MRCDGVEVLDALRARGLKPRFDPSQAGAWDADCPSCHPRAAGLWPLRVTEWYPGDVVRLACVNGCSERAIFNALGLVPTTSVAQPPLADDGPVDRGGRSRLRVLDTDRMATSDPPRVPWLGDPLLARSAVTMLVGREGQGKSMLAQALAAGIGHGSTVAGIDCRQGRVMIIDAENGEAEIHRRIRGLGVKPGTLVYVEADGFDLRTDLADVEALLDEHRPDALMFDSLRSLAPGLDENDSGEAEAALGPVRSLTRRRGCATLVLHHAGKASNGYRGSTAIGAAVDLGFTLAREGEDPHRRTLTCWKSRIAAEPAPRTISLQANDGRISVTAVERATSTAAGTRTDELTDRLATIAAERGILAWHELAALAGVEPESGTAKRARRRAIDDNKLATHGRGFYGPPAASSVRPVPIGDVDGRTITDAGEQAA